MDKTAQRIAFAKILGWKPCVDGSKEAGFLREGWYRPDGTFAYPYELPDIDDLNVIHEAEKVLFKENNSYWQYRLTFQSVKGLGGNNHEKHFMATAAQRVEAILKTLKLWTD